MNNVSNEPEVNDKGDTNKKALKRQGERDKRQNFLQVYKGVMGNISKTCEQVGLSRQTFYRWYDGDDGFRLRIDAIDHSLIDFAEGKLKEQIDKGNMIAIIFFLTNRNPERWKDKRAVISNQTVLQRFSIDGQQAHFSEEEEKIRNQMRAELEKHFGNNV